MPRTVNVNYVTKEVKILLHDSETESLAAATAIAAAESAQEAKDVVVDNLQDSLDAIDAKTETEKTEIATLGQEYVDSASQKVGEANTILTAIRNEYGYPFTATTVADMTDTTKIYVYTGSETGYTNGNWYYYDGSAWVSGGIYNAVAFTTDTTLTVSSAAADAQVVGDKFTESTWLTYDENKLENSTYTMVVQVNGKVRGKIEVDSDTSKEDMEKLAMEIDNVKVFTEGKEIVKTIVVPKKLVNIVVK